MDEFLASLAGPTPPDLPPALAALWWDRSGNWKRAHECAQSDEGADAAAVHGYLHRKDGDLSNARYWYARAGRNVAASSLDAEWTSLMEQFAAK